MVFGSDRPACLTSRHSHVEAYRPFELTFRSRADKHCTVCDSDAAGTVDARSCTFWPPDPGRNRAKTIDFPFGNGRPGKGGPRQKHKLALIQLGRQLVITYRFMCNRNQSRTHDRHQVGCGPLRGPTWIRRREPCPHTLGDGFWGRLWAGMSGKANGSRSGPKLPGPEARAN